MADPGRRVRALVAAACSVAALAAGVAGGTPAVAADGLDADTRVADWDTAAATLGTAGSLWEPRWRAGLRQDTRVQVVADNLAFANGAVTAGDTAASARYGRGERSFWRPVAAPFPSSPSPPERLRRS